MHVASSWRLNGDMVAVTDVSFEVKRRSIFCVAFGLAGDGKFEFLGEPAIGLDPESRFRFQSRSLHQAAKCPRDGDSGDHALLGGGERIL